MPSALSMRTLVSPPLQPGPLGVQKKTLWRMLQDTPNQDPHQGPLELGRGKNGAQHSQDSVLQDFLRPLHACRNRLD